MIEHMTDYILTSKRKYWRRLASSIIFVFTLIVCTQGPAVGQTARERALGTIRQMQIDLDGYEAERRPGYDFCLNNAPDIKKPSDIVWPWKCWADLQRRLVKRYPSLDEAIIGANLHNYLESLATLYTQQQITGPTWEALRKSAIDLSSEQTRQSLITLQMRLDSLINDVQMQDLRNARNAEAFSQWFRYSQQMMAPQGNPLLRCERDFNNPSILNCRP